LNRNIFPLEVPFLWGKKTMKKLFFALTLLVQIACSGNKPVAMENWVARLDGAIFAEPLVEGNSVYVGTERGLFYRIDAISGGIAGSIDLKTPIRSKAIYHQGRLFIESMGDLVCLDAASLREVSRFMAPVEEKTDMVDPWDYYHSSPVLHNGYIYYVAGMGLIRQVDPKTNRIEKEMHTPGNAEIRSRLAFNGNRLFLGDNNGVIHEYNLDTNGWATIFKSFTDRPYPTYGYISGGPVIEGETLYFGARNETMSAIDLSTRSVKWTQRDDNGSWWPAEPVVTSGNVIYSGSDNLKVMAVSTETGQVQWLFRTDHNIFGTPLVVDDVLLLGTGNSYFNRQGNGSVYSINLKNGRLINKYKPGGNVFASVTRAGNNLLVATTTGKVISINKDYFVQPPVSNVEICGEPTFTFASRNEPIGEYRLGLSVRGKQAIRLGYKLKCDDGMADTLVVLKCTEKDKVFVPGDHLVSVYVNALGLKPGTYNGTIEFTVSNGVNEIVTPKPFAVKVNETPVVPLTAGEFTDIAIDEVNGTVTMKFTAFRPTHIRLKLAPIGQPDQVWTMFETLARWGVYRIERDLLNRNYIDLEKGRYHMTLESDGHSKTIDFERK